MLALASLIPLAAFGGLVAYLLVQHQRESLSEAAQSRALTFLTAVDSELDSETSALRALAAVPSLSDGDLAYFRRIAADVLKSQPNWLRITVSSPAGAIVLSVPETTRAASGRAELEGGLAGTVSAAPLPVGDVSFDPDFSRWVFPVHVPVRRGGNLNYVLSATVAAAAMNDIIAAQRLPGDWGAVIIDRNNRFVARNWDAEKFIGQLASPSLRAALAKSPHGWFQGRTVEGKEVYSPYWRSEKTGWAISMGYPTSAVGAEASRVAWLLGVGLLLALAVALLLARMISGRIAEPIASLAGATDAIARGVAPELAKRTDIEEVRKLEGAMLSAAEAVRERKTLLEREKHALESADRAKDEFLAMLSHELRNPLAALTSAAHVLKIADPASRAASEARRVVERQTKQMTRLVGDLLDISRITLGRLTLDLDRLDLGEAVARLVNTWNASGRFERHRVTLDTKPAWVDADRARIEQIAANLLDNALKFTPSGKAITIGVGVEGGEAVLRVADEGAGIAPGDAERVFELFVSGDRAGAGLGIGLALVKRLAELHGGSVSVQSAGTGAGTVFVVRLPAAAAPANVDAAPLARRAIASRSVLIVEDNDDARRMLEAALALEGHVVRSAANGKSGLALADQTRPDVALIDIGLPDIDGYEVARHLRAKHNGRRISLVAVTGFGQPEDQQRAIDAGFDAHIVKPVNPERLKQVLAELA